MFKIYKNKYVVYDNGDIYLIGAKEVRKLKPWVTNSGYKQVNINRKSQYVHRVVIEAFKGKSELQVDHIDNEKFNNNLDNLQYLSFEENNAKGNGYKILYNGKKYETMKELADDINVKPKTLYSAYRLNGSYKGKEIIKK